MIKKLEPQKFIKENIYTVKSDVTSYEHQNQQDYHHDYPIHQAKRRPIPVFPNYVNLGEVFARENFAVINHMNSTGEIREWSVARKTMLDSSVYNSWDSEWRHMELRYAVATDVGKCSWCKSEDMPILKKEIIVREQKTHTTFNSLHKYCALDKLVKLKSEIEIGIERLENMINKTNGMRRGNKK